jgi:hypothetical protein
MLQRTVVSLIAWVESLITWESGSVYPASKRVKSLPSLFPIFAFCDLGVVGRSYQDDMILHRRARLDQRVRRARYRDGEYSDSRCETLTRSTGNLINFKKCKL